MIGPRAPDYATPAIKAVWAEVADRWGSRVTSWGVRACRYIAGTTTWSQHAFDNAWDIHGPIALLDVIAAFLRSAPMRPYVAQVLWRVPDHFDHIHVSGRPMFTGTPACAPGVHQQYPTPAEQRAEPLPQTVELIGGETWAPASKMAARELERRANRILRVPDVLGRIIGGR